MFKFKLCKILLLYHHLDSTMGILSRNLSKYSQNYMYGPTFV